MYRYRAIFVLTSYAVVNVSCILPNSGTLVFGFNTGAADASYGGHVRISFLTPSEDRRCSNLSSTASTPSSIFTAERSSLMHKRRRHSFLHAAHSEMCRSVAFRDTITDEDVTFVRKTLLKEKMNPLSISKETLVVAYDPSIQQSSEKDEKFSTTRDIVGFGQIRPTSETNYEELASLYVLPQHRKKGIGTAITQHLLDAFDQRQQQQKMVGNRNSGSVNCCLLTLRPTIPFYTKFGFIEVKDPKDIPPPLQLEYKAGQLLSFVLGNDLVCMVRDESRITVA